MKQVKRNKGKVWSKCYGKPFIIRKALGIAQMVMISAQAQAKLSLMTSYSLPAGAVAAMKAVAMAQHIVDTAKAIADKSHEINKGFCG